MVSRISTKNLAHGCLLALLMSGMNTGAMNLLRPYDTLIRPEYTSDKTAEVAVFAEHGFQAHGYNCDSCGVNVLQIWQCDQDALAMLKGFDPSSPMGQLLSKIDASDDGVRGHVRFDGSMYYDSVAFVARYYFLPAWFLHISLPVYRMKLTDVCCQDFTKDLTDEDKRVKQYLTNNICSLVRQLGCLDLGPWTRTGIGDINLLLEWLEDFEQHKPLLKNVRVNWRLGTTIPTGLRQDEDKLMALPFGCDGSMGLLFGTGLDLTLGRYFKTGFDVQLLQVFGNTRARRIKTDKTQTDLLLLEKAEAYKDFGLMQRFNLYVQFYQFLKGLSLKIGYQYRKHGDDFLCVCSEKFSNAIANTAQSLQDWTSHQIITNLSYDFEHDRRVKPYFSVYTDIPFNGKRSVLFPILGVAISLDF